MRTYSEDEQRIRQIPPNRVYFNWDIIHQCNYNCTYCHFTVRGWHNYQSASVIPDMHALTDAWDRIRQIYGCCHIAISGGEPTIHNRFFDLLERLSSMHTLEIVTNLSFEPDLLIGRVPPRKLRIASSFHPEFASIDSFILKAKKLKNSGIEIFTNFVAYPPQLPKIAELKKIFRDEGIPFFIMPFVGTYENRTYPRDYGIREQRLYQEALCGSDGELSRDILAWRTGKIPRPSSPAAEPDASATARPDSSRDPVCRMGQMYAKICPDGRTVRCCAFVSGKLSPLDPASIGNIFEKDFRLHKDAQPCKKEPCPCDRCMILGNESKWVKRWKIAADNAADISRKTTFGDEKTKFGWDLCYTCNYRCAYCRSWERATPNDIRISVEEWEKVWNRISSRYGRCHIYISGGEPSSYPDFENLVLRLVQNHDIEVCTNLSWDTRRLTSECPPGELTICPTFHPMFADFDDFLQKTVKIKDYLPASQVYTIAYGDNILRMAERSRRFAEYGIKLVPTPLCTDEKPANSQKEEKLIETLSPYAGNERIGYQLGRQTPKGKLCRAGSNYAVIRADGKVDRCSQTTGGGIGNILDPDFQLSRRPLPCPKDHCPVESQWIVQ